jgi:putative aldouronate transport system permease protein
MRGHTLSKIISYVVLGLVLIFFIFPLLMMAASSVSSNQTVLKQGYSIIIQDFDLSAYKYLLQHSGSLLRSASVSLATTVAGTAAGILFTAMLAYPLSRPELPARKIFTFFVIFTLLFNGGLVPTYLIYTQVLGIKNNLLALIIPNLLLNGFNVLILRTFFQLNVPDALIEAAKIDGASEGKILFKFIFPLSLPAIVTVGLIQAILYWNDWFNAMIYISDTKWLGLQAVLNQMLTNINYLTSLSGGGAFGGQSIPAPTTTLRMAMAVIGVLPFLAIYPFTQKYFAKGVTLGAVKE